MFAYEKLPGLPRERLLDAIEPVLRAHGLAGVEIVWRTDAQGRVLVLTLESAAAPEAGQAEPGPSEPGPSEPGHGVTLEVCSRVSRDLSTAFDVLELFDGNYRLEVGSPGLERRLYTVADYQRFRGKLAKLKLSSPVAGQSVITGTLAGVDAEGRVLLERDDAPRSEPKNRAESEPNQLPNVLEGAAASDTGAATATRAIAFEQIRSGQLVVDWREMGFSPQPRQRAGRRSAARGRQ